MYSFEANAGRKKNTRVIRLLLLLIFVLVIALVGVSIAYFRARGASSNVSDALLARATSEAGSAQTAVYRLTQSSGTNTQSLLANIRSHVYALQCLNTLTANIYGAGTQIIDPALLDACIGTLDASELRMQAGSVLTDLFTTLRDQVNEVSAVFGLQS